MSQALDSEAVTEQQPATEDPLADVRRRGRSFKRAQERRDAERDALYAAVRAAHKAGRQPKELIDASGLSRMTVFDVIKDKGDTPA